MFFAAITDSFQTLGIGIACVVLGYIFGIPLLILATFKQQAKPRVEDVHDDWADFPRRVKAQFDQKGTELEELGFEYQNTLALPQQMDNVKTILQVYVNRQTTDAAMLVSMFGLVNDVWSLNTQYVEFNARWEDGFELNTGNSPEPSAFKVPPDTLTTFAPWLEYADELFNAHKALCKQHGPGSRKELRLDRKFNGDCIPFVAEGMIREMEAACEDGYLKKSPTHYKATFVGAYLMTWKQLPPFKQIVLARRNAVARKRLSEAGFAE